MKQYLTLIIAVLVVVGVGVGIVYSANKDNKEIPSTVTSSSSLVTSAQTSLVPVTIGENPPILVVDTGDKIVVDGKLKINDLTVGTGELVKSGDTIKINYKGTLVNGTEFDSSYKRNDPFTTQIGVGQVIPGWDQGIVGMQVGGKRKLTIDPSFAYGDRAQGAIPAGSQLIFETELLEIVK
jgi:FKBP-type peptidyl-prolyl cis-trans isomerase